ncbi:MAG: 7-cyano-7-deazaguanine synthase QueC [Kiritimatiellales bacterium]
MVKKKAVVLLSGGLDSATTLAIAKAEGFECYALSFCYGQRHAIELECAKQTAKSITVKEHRIISIDLTAFGGSALTDMNIDVPHQTGSEEIPVTYVPARNTVFLSYALAWAEVLESFDIFIGTNSLDYSGYPDCRPEFIAAFEITANLATKAGISSKQKFKIHTPLQQLTKAEIIRCGLKLGVDYSKTSSCYDPAADGSACGTCDSCRLRLKGFLETGIVDPRKYIPVIL